MPCKALKNRSPRKSRQAVKSSEEKCLQIQTSNLSINLCLSRYGRTATRLYSTCSTIAWRSLIYKIVEEIMFMVVFPFREMFFSCSVLIILRPIGFVIKPVGQLLLTGVRSLGNTGRWLSDNINAPNLIRIQRTRLPFRRKAGGGPPMTGRLSWWVAIPGQISNNVLYRIRLREQSGALGLRYL